MSTKPGQLQWRLRELVVCPLFLEGLRASEAAAVLSEDVDENRRPLGAAVRGIGERKKTPARPASTR